MACWTGRREAPIYRSCVRTPLPRVRAFIDANSPKVNQRARDEQRAVKEARAAKKVSLCREIRQMPAAGGAAAKPAGRRGFS